MRIPFALLLAVMILHAAPTDERGLKLHLKKMYAEQRVALVIGNADYDTYGDLRNPVNDARAMRDVLQQRRFEVMYLENGNWKEMLKILRVFGDKLDNGGIGLFFYAGHGITVDGKNYLIPVDADIAAHDEVRYQSIAVDQVLAKMESSGNRLNLVILDACRNDPFERGDGGGLAPLDAADGMYIAFATAPGKTAFDGKATNGIFTGALLAHIREPVPVEEVFKRVRADVKRTTQDKQVPWTSSSIVGDFYFTLPKIAPERYALTVIPEPSDATVYVTNIKERYHPGIKLQPQSYELKVVRNGYHPLQQTIFLEADTKLPVTLQKIEAPKLVMKTDAKTEPNPEPLPEAPRSVDEIERDYTWWYVGGGVALLGGGAAAAAGGGGGGDDGGSTGTVEQPSEISVTLTWEGSNNLDLVVEDPCGNHITAANPSASCGGYQGSLTEEANAQTVASTPKEVVTFANGGADGVYYIYVSDTYNRNGSATDFSITALQNGTTGAAQGTVAQSSLQPVMQFTHE